MKDTETITSAGYLAIIGRGQRPLTIRSSISILEERKTRSTNPLFAFFFFFCNFNWSEQACSGIDLSKFNIKNAANSIDRGEQPYLLPIEFPADLDRCMDGSSIEGNRFPLSLTFA